MSKKLTKKVALVTGGSRGIGAAIARALAAEGADVAISYLASEAATRALVGDIKKQGIRAEAFKTDQAEPEAVENLVQSVARRFGGLDILVNNAGVFVGGPVDNPDNDLVALDRQYAINLFAVITAIRAAVKVMSDGGRIITIGSMIAARAGSIGVADYAATKAGVVGYSKGAARDLGRRHITVNVVQPGSVDTEMNPVSGPSADAQKSATALKRFGSPEEIAAAVVFLASPEAAFITGTVLNVDGGYAA